jgi:metallophosphoesterase superfamily enzyme
MSKIVVASDVHLGYEKSNKKDFLEFLEEINETKHIEEFGEPCSHKESYYLCDSSW